MQFQSFSFIIPAYNDAAGLQRHLQYFFARPEHIQLVIVDDGSQDETADLIAAANPPANVRLIYHRQPENRGPAAARNVGLTLADGDYVMFLDADDVLADCFFTYVRLSPLQNGADLVLFKYHLAMDPSLCHTYEMHRLDAAFFSRIESSGFPTGTFTLKTLPSVLNTVNFPWNKIYRRDFIQSAGIRFPELRMHEDILPHWHSFLQAKEFGVLSWAPPLITHYELPGGSRATNYIGEQRLHVFPLLRDIYAELVENSAADLILPEFHSFCDNLFSWMIDALCAGNSAEVRAWRPRYQEEITKYRAFLENGTTGAYGQAPQPGLVHQEMR